MMLQASSQSEPEQSLRRSHRRAGRRRFLKLAAVGGGLALLGARERGLPPEVVLAAPAAAETDALLLNCIDFRLTDDVTRYMEARGLAKKYDQLVLAGASIAAVNDKFPAWGQTFWEHLEVAIELHRIHKVILIDHRDCGAYKVILGPDFATDPPTETAVHAQYMAVLRDQIYARHPELGVELHLMALDGSVEDIA